MIARILFVFPLIHIAMEEHSLEQHAWPLPMGLVGDNCWVGLIR
jgi:hypothetical protein